MKLTKDIWEVLAQKLDTKSLVNCLLLNKETYKILSLNEAIWRRKIVEEFDDSCISYRDTHNKKRSLKDLYFQINMLTEEYTEDKALEVLCSKNSKENLDLIYYMVEKKEADPNRGAYGAAKDGNSSLMEYFLKGYKVDPFSIVLGRCEAGDISNVSHNFNDYRRAERDRLYFALGVSGNEKNIVSVVQRTEIDIDWGQIVEGMVSEEKYDLAKSVIEKDLVPKIHIFRAMGRHVKSLESLNLFEIPTHHIRELLFGAIDGGNVALLQEILYVPTLAEKVNLREISRIVLVRANSSGYKKVIKVLEEFLKTDFYGYNKYIIYNEYKYNTYNIQKIYQTPIKNL